MGVRIGIVTVRDPLYHPNRRLLEAARARGHEAVLLHPYRVWPGVRAGLPVLVGPAAGLDVALPRQGSEVRDSCLALLRQFRLLGVGVVNGPDAVAVSRDQFLTLQALAQAGVPVPDTVFINAPGALEAAAAAVGGYPVVLKLPRGRKGEGVALARGPDEARRVAAGWLDPARGLLVQRFIPPGGRRDVRGLVIGGRVAAALALRPGPGEFRANFRRSRGAEAVEPEPGLAGALLGAARAVGLEIAGVDAVVDARGDVRVLEVNYAPGFEGLEQVTGRDIAGEIVEHAARRAGLTSGGGAG